MKKVIIFTIALLAFGTTVQAETDRPITINQLPENAQAFIQQHFPGEKISLAKMEREFMETTYEIIFTNGSKIDFFKNGEWKEVDCKYATVPPAVIPSQIANYISQTYPDASVVQIDWDKREYEVKLTNGLELTFNKNFYIIDIDD